MKKIIYSFFTLIISLCCLCSFTVSAADIIASDIYDNTIFREQYRTGSLGSSIFSDMVANFITDAIKEVDSEVKGNSMNHVKDEFYSIANYRLQNLKMPSFDYLSGKANLKWFRTLEQQTPYSVQVDVELFWCSGYEYGYTPWLTWDDGVKIPVNCLVYTIKRSDGVATRYFIKPRQDYNAFPFAVRFTVNDNNDYFELPSNAWETTVYRITGDETYTQAFTIGAREKRLYYNSVNDITFGLPRNNYGVPITMRTPPVEYPREPSDRELVAGYIDYYPTGNSSYYPSTDFDFWVSYYSLNDKLSYDFLDESCFTADYQKNLYFNSEFQNGDLITTNNYDEKYNEAFAPVFNVDLGDLDIDTIIPQITGSLEPVLRLGIDDLLDALMDFFGDMPDIGLTWDSNTSNNYYDIVPLDPDPGDPGGGGCNWETPYYAPVNTSVYIPAVVPSYSTYAAVTAPANVLANSKNVLQNGWTFLDVLGLLPLIIPLTIVAILWRFTGE